MRRVVVTALLFAFTALVATPPDGISAHHDHHGHTGYILPGEIASYEMNNRTTTGLSIRMKPIYIANPFWGLVLSNAMIKWNDGIAPIAGFSPFADSDPGYDISVNSGNDINQCWYIDDNPANGPAHGCVNGWYPNAPAAAIYMYDPVFTGQTCCYHMLSDLMHEMGHILYYGGEHYGTSYNCVSIMGHCNTTILIDVQNHDKDDYRAAYRLTEAPDAAYAQLTSSSNLQHFFEGGYDGGNGRTQHAERRYWSDRAIGSVTGNYQTYIEVGRRIDNVDDTVPNNFNMLDLPPSGPGPASEWCFKMRGEAGGVALADSGYWSPLSRAYCVANRGNGTGTGVYVVSNRNGYVAFRVWNYSNNTISGVALLKSDGVTHVCDWSSIPKNQSSSACFTYGLGDGSGYLILWYNYVNHGTIGFDAR